MEQVGVRPVACIKFTDDAMQRCQGPRNELLNAGIIRVECRFIEHVLPIMNFHKPHRECVVTLSAAKGLSRWAQRCFAALSMTAPALVVKIHYRGELLIVIQPQERKEKTAERVRRRVDSNFFKENAIRAHRCCNTVV